MMHELGVQFEEELQMELFVNIAVLRDVNRKAEQNANAQRAILIEDAKALWLEIDHLIELPNLNRAKELCRRMQQIATLLKLDDLESASRKALNALQNTGSVARAESLLREVQSLSKELTTLQDVA